MSAASRVFESASCAACMRGEWKAPDTLSIFACLAPIVGAILHISSSTWGRRRGAEVVVEAEVEAEVGCVGVGVGEGVGEGEGVGVGVGWQSRAP